MRAKNWTLAVVGYDYTRCRPTGLSRCSQAARPISPYLCDLWRPLNYSARRSGEICAREFATRNTGDNDHCGTASGGKGGVVVGLRLGWFSRLTCAGCGLPLSAQLICANDTDSVYLYRVVINELRSVQQHPVQLRSSTTPLLTPLWTATTIDQLIGLTINDAPLYNDAVLTDDNRTCRCQGCLEILTSYG